VVFARTGLAVTFESEEGEASYDLASSLVPRSLEAVRGTPLAAVPMEKTTSRGPSVGVSHFVTLSFSLLAPSLIESDSLETSVSSS